MIRYFKFACVAALVAPSFSTAQDTREVFEFEVDAGADDVWKAFTTTIGLKSWVAPLAEIDFKVGGKWRANYNAKGKLGDPTTIENTILCYDPKRMISLKATKFPEGFPFANAAKEAWTVFYFAPVSASRTKITVVGLGYNDSEESQKMRSFFATANRHSLNELNKALQRRSAD